MTKHRIETVLVANRGEIALRILRTCTRMGIRTVAVFSDADADAPFVRAADLAVRIGPPPAAESYLVIEKIIAAARATGADAIHPGYGFLAENAQFAAACADANIVFIGHSTGGIVLRHMLDDHFGEFAEKRVGVVLIALLRRRPRKRGSPA